MAYLVDKFRETSSRVGPSLVSSSVPGVGLPEDSVSLCYIHPTLSFTEAAPGRPEWALPFLGVTSVSPPDADSASPLRQSEE